MAMNKGFHTDCDYVIYNISKKFIYHQTNLGFISMLVREKSINTKTKFI